MRREHMGLKLWNKRWYMAVLAAVLLTGCKGVSPKLQTSAQTETGIEPTGQSLDKTENDVAPMKSAKAMEAAEPEKLPYPPDDYDNWNKCLGDNHISDDFKDSLKRFSFTSGSEVLKQAQENGMYSPLSLYYALALAGSGAEGETSSEISDVLGVSDREALAEQCRKLYTWYIYQEQWDGDRMKKYGADQYDSKLQLANSLWISDQLNIKEDYQKMAAEKFFASSFGVDFKDPQTGKIMGDWISGKTNGAINPQLTPDPETLLAIINTLYFYGGWTTPFEEALTKTDEFTLEDGTKVSCPFLNRTDIMGSYQRGDGYLLSCLHTNNDCQMVFLLPDEDRKVEEFLEKPELFQEAMDGDKLEWNYGTVTWKVPKFSFGSSFKLEDTLQNMGLGRMFGEFAEFGGISDQPLKVDSVIQETHIGVDEQGVEGAAYTMMALGAGAALNQGQKADMILDRPFLFGIRDAGLDVWLFLGVCRNPEE